MKATNAQIIEAMDKSLGFQSIAAKTLNITPSALTQRLQRNPKLQKVLDKIMERRLDIAESKLFKLVQKGNLKAITFFLQHKGQNRGYGKNPSDLSIQGNVVVGFEAIPYQD